MLDITEDIKLLEDVLERPFGEPPQMKPFEPMYIIDHYLSTRMPVPELLGFLLVAETSPANHAFYSPFTHTIFVPTRSSEIKYQSHFNQYAKWHELMHAYVLPRSAMIASLVPGPSLGSHLNLALSIDKDIVEEKFVLQTASEGLSEYAAQETAKQQKAKGKENKYATAAQKGYLPVSPKHPLQKILEGACRKNIGLVQTLKNTSWKEKKFWKTVIDRGPLPYIHGYLYVRGMCERNGGNVAYTIDQIMRNPPTTLAELNDGIMAVK